MSMKLGQSVGFEDFQQGMLCRDHPILTNASWKPVPADLTCASGTRTRTL